MVDDPTIPPNPDATEFKYKVDGVDKTITLEEARTRVQKGEAADERFRTASDRLAAAEAKEAELKPLEDLRDNMELLRAKTLDTPEGLAAFRTAAKTLGASEDQIADMVAAQTAATGQPAPINSTAGTASTQPVAATLPANQNRVVTRMGQFLADCDSKGIDPVKVLEQSQQAADANVDVRSKEIVGEYLDKHKILGTICKNKTRREVILQDAYEKVFRRVDGGAAFSQAVIEESLNEVSGILDMGAKLAPPSGPSGIGVIPAASAGLERFHRLHEKPVWNPSDAETMAEYIDRSDEYNRHNAETEAAIHAGT